VATVLANGWLLNATAARDDLLGLGLILALALLLYGVRRLRLQRTQPGG
jgi:hypothetical protein